MQEQQNSCKHVKTVFLKTYKGTRASKYIFAIAALFFPLYITFVTELISQNSYSGVFKFIASSPLAFMLSCIIVGFIYCIFALVTKRPYVASIITGIPLLALGISNYFKMQILAKAVLPSDILFLSGDNDVSGFISSLSPTLHMILGFIITVLYIVFLGVMNCRFQLRPASTIIIRVLIPCFCAATLYGAVMSDFSRNTIFPLFGYDVSKAYDTEYNYRSHGIIGSFTINIGNLKVEKIPYSEEIISEAAGKYSSDMDNPGFEVKPNVIIILSEAFWDIKKLSDVNYSVNPIGNFESLADEGWNIDMVSTVYSGGTVRPEFEVLTGLTVERLPDGVVPYQQFLHRETDSLASYFKGYGYRTVGLHTYLKNFYNRTGAYPLMGFDKFYGKEDIPIEAAYKGDQISDDTFVDWIIYELEKSEDTPVFIQAISMQNHAPYDDKGYEEYTIDVTSDTLSDGELVNIQNLAQGIHDADLALKKLTDYLRGCETPTVILYYGDHLSYGGENYIDYINGGLLDTSDSSKWSNETHLAMYTTPALLWSNFSDEQEDVGYCSPYQLGALLLDYIEAPDNELYSFLDSYREILPVHNSMFSVTADGVFKKNSELTGLEQEYVDTHWLYTYDILIKKNYLLGNWSQ